MRATPRALGLRDAKDAGQSGGPHATATAVAVRARACGGAELGGHTNVDVDMGTDTDTDTELGTAEAATGAKLGRRVKWATGWAVLGKRAT